MKEELDAWAGCIAGTIPMYDYRRLLLQAGFEAPEIVITNELGVAGPRRRRQRLDSSSKASIGMRTGDIRSPIL